MMYSVVEKTTEGTRELTQVEAQTIHEAVLKTLGLVNNPPDRTMRYKIEGDRAFITLKNPARAYSVAAAR